MSGCTEDDSAAVVTIDGPVALIRLNEPQTLNALSENMREALADAARTVLEDVSVRAIVITGTGRAFCAGGNIQAMTTGAATLTHGRMTAVHRWLSAFLRAPKPIITAVNGIAVGAGFSLALLGDIVCVADNAAFKAGFAGIGACPDLGIAYTLPRAVGSVRAADILLSNRLVSAEEAATIGLASRVYKPEELLPKSLELAHQLANGPTLSFGLLKGLLRRAYEMPLEAFLEREAGAQAVAFCSEDFAEGVAAFSQKRPARFLGK